MPASPGLGEKTGWDARGPSEGGIGGSGSGRARGRVGKVKAGSGDGWN